MNTLGEIIAERPLLHRGETELQLPLQEGESRLNGLFRKRMLKTGDACYGISKDVAFFVFGSTQVRAILI
jgi:hypothetical protein